MFAEYFPFEIQHTCHMNNYKTKLKRLDQLLHRKQVTVWSDLEVMLWKIVRVILNLVQLRNDKNILDPCIKNDSIRSI